MRQIMVNGRFLTHPVTGVQRYATEIVLCLDRLVGNEAKDLEIILALPSRQDARSLPLKNIRITRFGLFKGHAWEQFDLLRHARGKLLLNLTASGPLLHGGSITVLHDVAAFAAPAGLRPLTKVWYRFSQPRLAKRALVLASVSRFSAQEIRRVFGFEGNIEIWPNGSDHVQRIQPAISEHPAMAGLHGRYVVAIASEQANKNIAQLERVSEALYRRHGLGIVLIGGKFAMLRGELSSTREHVIRTGYISDEEMAAIVKGATCLAFPSLYEGFGIPPLEAMAMGVPVVAARTSAIPEICGDAASYFEFDDDEGLLTVVGRLIEDPQFAQMASRRGLERARRFTWETSAKLVFDAMCRKSMRPVAVPAR